VRCTIAAIKSIGRTAEGAPELEAVMSDALPQQHPAVVLRSHYVHIRTLLVIALIAVVALTTAVVVLADDSSDPAPIPQTAAPLPQAGPADRSTMSVGGIRYDGGPDEGGGGTVSSSGSRYDGGPEEGTRGLGH
jgi:hypothetical protein